MKEMSNRLCRMILGGAVGATMCVFTPAARAQQVQGQDQAQAQATLAADTSQNAQLTDNDRAKLDQFLDDHKAIAKDLRKHPEWVNEEKYLKHHKDLRSFLDENPHLRSGLSANPEYAARTNERLADNRGDRDIRAGGAAQANANVQTGANANVSGNGISNTNTNTTAATNTNATTTTNTTSQRDANNNVRPAEGTQAQDRDRGNPNPDINRQELEAMDRFLDAHPDIDAQLQKNPALINQAGYVDAHPALQQFLNQHPGVQEEVAETPRYFMYRAGRLEAHANGRLPDADRGNPNPDITRRDLVTMDQFLDSHPEIDEQLQAKPSLVNDADYLKAHPALQTFLNQHAQVRAELAETPSYFIHRTDRMDSRGDLGRLDQFLDDHSKIAKDLRDRPERIQDQDYLKHHKDLRAFLDQNPRVRQAVERNPDYMTQREARLQMRTQTPHTTPQSTAPNQTGTPQLPQTPSTQPVQQQTQRVMPQVLPH